jgi:hypothetical protein
MKIIFEQNPTCFWHADCEVFRGNGIMAEIRREPERSLMKCMHCGKCGYYPVGGCGCILVEEEKDTYDLREN